MAHDFTTVGIDPIKMISGEGVRFISAMKLSSNEPEAVKRYMYEVLDVSEKYAYESCNERTQAFLGGTEKITAIINNMKIKPIVLDGYDKDLNLAMAGMDAIIHRLTSGDVSGIRVAKFKGSDEEVEEMKRGYEKGDARYDSSKVEFVDMGEIAEGDRGEHIDQMTQAMESGKEYAKKALEKWYADDTLVDKSHKRFIDFIASSMMALNQGEYLGVIID